jgi:hypothetical protein
LVLLEVFGPARTRHCWLAANAPVRHSWGECWTVVVQLQGCVKVLLALRGNLDGSLGCVCMATHYPLSLSCMLWCINAPKYSHQLFLQDKINFAEITLNNAAETER